MNFSDPRLQALYEQINIIQIVLERPVVQRQLLAFIIVFALSWFLPFLLERILSRIAPKRLVAMVRANINPEIDTQTTTYSQTPHIALSPWQTQLILWAYAIEHTFFPILGLIFSQLAITYFKSNLWRWGLIEQLRLLFWLLLAYRILEGLLPVFLPKDIALRYTRRFLRPFFAILMIWSVYTQLVDTFPLGTIELFTILGASISLRSLFIAIVTFYIFFACSQIIADLLNRVILPRTDIDDNLVRAIGDTTNYTLIIIGILASLGVLGINLSALTIIGGGLSVGIGFGMQDLVANVVSGVLLLFDRTLRPGDVVEIAGKQGVVHRLGMRSTVLRTQDNVEVFVPNKTLLTSAVSTYTYTNRLVRDSLTLDVSSDVDPDQMRTLLLAITRQNPLILEKPIPQVYFTSFSASTLQFELTFWLDKPEQVDQIMSDLRFTIWRGCTEKGFAIQ